MAITRRQFIRRTGLATAGTLLGPSLFASPFVRRAFADLGDRYLVVIFLDGGNDGQNTVIPVDDGSGTLRADYEAHRFAGGGGIRLTPAQLASTLVGTDPNTGAQLALHPGFIGLKHLYDQGSLAVIQGCGYPEYSLSHDEARTIWQSANPLRNGTLAGTGWVGRHLAATYGGSQIPGVCISDEIGADFRQSTTSVLAINDLENFGFPWDGYGSDEVAKAAAFSSLYASAAGGPVGSTQAFLGTAGAATLTSTNSYPALHGNYVADRPSFNQAYADIDRSVAYDLREVAKIIYGVSSGAPGVTSRFFRLSNGGYDTHSDQGGATGQQYDLHREVGDSLEAFYADLTDMGVADKVLTVVWSEFSRRIEQNGSGTDHGSQGPMFVIGGPTALNGGVYGNHPDIHEDRLENDGNTTYRQSAHPYRSTDFRDVFGTILKHWLNMSQPQILSNILIPDPIAGEYWNVSNFDMGFLP
ncbi:DUF1501 domain-containing protein [Candidatus Binatia bacterium]|nr:DUF1501 domain-containing protein [Candidatus Binatia bacterium]